MEASHLFNQIKDKDRLEFVCRKFAVVCYQWEQKQSYFLRDAPLHISAIFYFLF